MYAANSALLNALAQRKISFKQVLKFIDTRYDHKPTAFKNGAQSNAATENQGSAKVLSFAALNHFGQLDTLALFAEHLQAVLDHPEYTDHQNIRQFIRYGWNGVKFEGQALSPKTNIAQINLKIASIYAHGGSEFEVEEPAQEAELQPEQLLASPEQETLIADTKDQLSTTAETAETIAAPTPLASELAASSASEIVEQNSSNAANNPAPALLDDEKTTSSETIPEPIVAAAQPVEPESVVTPVIVPEVNAKPSPAPATSPQPAADPTSTVNLGTGSLSASEIVHALAEKAADNPAPSQLEEPKGP